MKLQLTSLLFLLLLSSNLLAQCFDNGWSHPQIQGNTLRCVHSLGNVVYAGGDAGTILKSLDGGNTWSFLNSNTVDRILGIFFTDINTGYASSRIGVHKTTDGGLSWQFIQLTTSAWMNDVEFVSDSTGIVCGQNGRIYRTVDAGTTWSLQHLSYSYPLFALHFPSPLIGYAVGGTNSSTVGGIVLKTTDGGITWSSSSPHGNTFRDVYFTSTSTGYCATEFGKVVSTADGGATWLVNTLSNQSFYGIQFASPSEGIVAGVGWPWVTSDGGSTWTQVQIPEYFNSTWALSTPNIGQHLLVGTGGQIVNGSNLLSTAQVVTEAETASTIYDIIFTDDLNGIACGNGALVMKTSDGGGSWQRDTTWAYGQNYHALAKTNPQTAFIAGTGGQIWKTTDWGTSWNQQFTGVTTQFKDISFINQDTGLVAGTNGMLLRTIDSGNSWSPVSSGTTKQLNAIDFNNKGIGWVVGEDGAVVKSIDYGSTCQNANFGSTTDKRDIVFFDDSIGYASGSTSNIYYTHNGGATWGGSFADYGGANSIQPLSAGEAVAVGSFGNYYITVDTGRSWTILPLYCYNLLYKVYAQDSTIWVTGGYGTILKSGFGGQVKQQFSAQICAGDSIQIGNNWISSNGVYYDTLSGLCDTTREITVQVLPISQSANKVHICFGDSLFVGGAYQTGAGFYLDTFANTLGCDSFHTTNVQFFPPSTLNYADTICSGDSILFFNQILTSSGIYRDSSLTNMNGCDSLITLDLTVLGSSSNLDIQTACDAFSWIDGNTYSTSNNSATWVLTNSVGCDSVITLDLTINISSTGADIQAACDTYTWIDGITYTASNNTSTWVLTNSVGCDSVITLDLTVYAVDTSVTQNGGTLSANLANVAYQWLDCDNNFSIISGETNQSYTTTTSGNYAVEITQNNCKDTSACYPIVMSGVPVSHVEHDFLLLENPTDGSFSIDLRKTYPSTTVSIYDIGGKMIKTIPFYESQLLNLKLEAPAGVYLVTVDLGEGEKTVFRLVRY